MKILSKYMYGGKNTYKKGGVYVPQTQMSDEELSEKAYGKSKGPQRFTRKDVKPQTQMTNEELSKLASGTKQSEISTKPTTKVDDNKKDNQNDNQNDDKKGDKIYNLKHDRKWEYKVTDGKWFARKKGTEKWHDISKFPDSVNKLDGEHPNARGQNMKHGGTLMSKYAKAYEEGGTPDSSKKEIEDFIERYGYLPPNGEPLSFKQWFLNSPKHKGSSRHKGKEDYLNEHFRDINSYKDLVRAATKNENFFRGFEKEYSMYMNSIKRMHKKLVKKGRAGEDISQYKEIFDFKRGGGNLDYRDESGKPIDTNHFGDFMNSQISEMGQKYQELINQIKEKDERGDALTDEEIWLLGGTDFIDDFGKTKEEAQKERDAFDIKMSKYWGGQGLKIKEDGTVDYGGTETKKPVKTESNITTAPIVSDPSPADGAGVDADAEGADGEQINTEEKPPVVEETRAQKRKRLRKEWYESQSTPASMQGEKEDPSDPNVGGGTGGGTPPDTGGGTPPDTGGGTPPDTSGETPPADDFSGTNPHPRRSEEWFEWNKRKRAAMHAKHGAITKKINYLKGGMYGKRTFRR